MDNRRTDMCSETGFEIPAEEGISEEKETGGWLPGNVEKVKRWMVGKMRRSEKS